MATITTIAAGDNISDSRGDINTNFSNLNTDKIEADSTDTLTNKTIDADNSTISNLAHGAEVDNPTSGVHGATGNVVGTSDTQTLTNKTLTTPTIGDFSNSAHDHSNAAGGGSLVAASATVSGAVELATIAETDTGTDATRAVTPDGLAGSNFGERAVQMVVFDFTTDTATGDGKFYFHIDSRLGGMNLVDVHAEVITAGTTGTTDIQIANVTQAVDMLTTKITIDSGETGSDTAATAAVIDTTNDDVAENDVIRVDCDAVSTTPAKGLIVTLGFRLP